MAVETGRRIVRTEKTCRGCGEVKSIDNFMEQWNNQRNRYYRVSKCDDCRKARKRDDWHRQADEHSVARRKRYAEDPEYRRRLLSAQYKNKYGISLDDRDSMLAAQGGVCANPGCAVSDPGPKGWMTDHDHSCCPSPNTCGECLRGIVCMSCNLALGHSGDSIERLEGLIEYLRRYEPIQKENIA